MCRPPVPGLTVPTRHVYTHTRHTWTHTRVSPTGPHDPFVSRDGRPGVGSREDLGTTGNQPTSVKSDPVGVCPDPPGDAPHGPFRRSPSLPEGFSGPEIPRWGPWKLDNKPKERKRGSDVDRGGPGPTLDQDRDPHRGPPTHLKVGTGSRDLPQTRRVGVLGEGTPGRPDSSLSPEPPSSLPSSLQDRKPSPRHHLSQ